MKKFEVVYLVDFNDGLGGVNKTLVVEADSAQDAESAAESDKDGVLEGPH